MPVQTAAKAGSAAMSAANKDLTNTAREEEVYVLFPHRHVYRTANDASAPLFTHYGFITYLSSSS